MRIALITDLPFLCEGTMYVNELERRLSGAGIAPTIFLVKDPRCVKLFDSRTGIGKIFSTSNLLRQLSDFDIIHVQFTYPLGFALTLLSTLHLLNKPIIIHTHGYDVFTVHRINYGLRRSRIGKFLTSYAWNRANEIVAVCKRARSEIEATGIEGEKIKLLYNGVDESRFSNDVSNASNELQKLRNENDIILLSVATISPVKNHVTMMNAFKKILVENRSRCSIKLALIGENLTRNVSVGGSDGIVYFGKVQHKDLPSFYSIADVFVLPSLSEAHPWSLLEAMSCRLPVVASNVGGIPETLDNQNLLVNPDDSDDLVDKLRLLIEMSAAERRRIGDANREIILKRFTLDIHLRELRRIYENAYT